MFAYKMTKKNGVTVKVATQHSGNGKQIAFGAVAKWGPGFAKNPKQQAR